MNSNTYQPHGTLIATLICKDGILIASDSRSSFTIGEGKTEKAYAFYDNEQKIFSLGKFKLATSGISMFNKKYWYQIVDEFNNTHHANNSLEKSFNEFHNYLNTVLNVSDSIIFKENLYLLAGYENSKPITLGTNSDGTTKEIRNGGLFDSGGVNEAGILFKNYINKPPNLELTCKNMAPILESAIYKFAKAKNNNMIGGPVQMFQINPDNTFVELKSFVPVKFNTYKEFAEAILNDKLKVEYLFSDSKEKLIKTLTEGIKLGY